MCTFCEEIKRLALQKTENSAKEVGARYNPGELREHANFLMEQWAREVFKIVKNSKPELPPGSQKR